MPSAATATTRLARHSRAIALACALVCAIWPALAQTPDTPPWEPTTPVLEGAQLALLDAALARLPPQRPGVTDLYVLGVAGDADEEVFRNEVAYLRQLSAQRWDAAGRMLALANQPDTLASEGALPLATYDSLGYALDALGQTLDPREDVLLLYLGSHGVDDSSVYLHTGPDEEDYLAPEDLAQLLDEAGIGNAVIVVSACYSGGFVPALKAANRMIITAARKDRPSFGCGNTDSATWFGRAFLVEALNATNDFAAAFGLARDTVRRREKEEGELPSQPQFFAGKAITTVLARWRAGLPASAPVPYPFVHSPPAGNNNRKSP
ncbi:MAG: peptidase C13 [Stenotrophomonas nitritireducens]|uniref:C13 family peptidase n=1 Tax=Stenotrophomonas nitritireducens TaxID=83617 RepID=UPI001AD31863|nr:C13 family peptidase [Stenotrophomonas nitritireducens]MBN8768715.1 peptidase C13 [Stenotrophomonas sp.]MBN8791984.1 peptidase C13 [Stenotrophomonas nitritireducens]